MSRCEMNPIEYPSSAPDHLPRNYGSYHQIYRLDGKLIAMSVLDILPSVSLIIDSADLAIQTVRSAFPACTSCMTTHGKGFRWERRV